MTLEQFDTFCASLPGTAMVVQWGNAHVWKVGDKIFAIASPWGPDRPDHSFKISFKCSDFSYYLLCEQPGVIPAPYLARAKWVQVQERDALDTNDLKSYISAAHEIIAAKLTVKARREHGLA